MLSTQFKIVITSSISAVLVTYGLWCFLTGILYSFISWGVCLVFLLVGVVKMIRLPAPTTEQVEAIVGKELHLEANGNYMMRMVAHRGAGLDAPENTLAAFRMCKEKGCDAVEFDVALTADGEAIVFHDNSLERMADDILVVKDAKWSQLANLDMSVKHPFRERFPKTNIPTLQQTVNELLSLDLRMFIDIKDNNVKMIPEIVNLFRNYPQLYTRAVVSSFYPDIIYHIRRKDPKIVCSMAYRPHSFAYDFFSYPDGPNIKRTNVWYRHLFLCLLDACHGWIFPRFTCYVLGLSIILLHKDSICGQTILEWRKKGIRVIAWTVNSPVEKQYYARYLKITYLTDTLTGEKTTHNVSS